MAYQALYRKWRPTQFDEVRGQDHIITTLKNQITMNRIGHAYIFSGTRGTGKTTVAKIFAKAVNCEHPVNGNPCNECSVCRSINAQNSANLVELDAASNNGVDNVRDIIETVIYRPTEGRYKVYIVDEVHMFSTQAFNAFLKTLEEPPEHVIFILATTEINKIPITIMSRCQRYDFRRISTATIGSQLKMLADNEGIDVEDEAIAYISRMADGSLRDGLSLLDRCNSFYIGEKLSYHRVLDILGAVDTRVFGELLRQITVQNVKGVLDLIDEILIQGRELSQFVTDFTSYLRDLLILKNTETPGQLVDVSAEQLVILKNEAKLVETAVLMRYIRIFSELSSQIKYSTQKRALTEIALIKLCQPSAERNLEALINRISILEKKLAGGIVLSAADTTSREDIVDTATQREELERALSEDIRLIVERWTDLMSNMPPGMQAILKGSKVREGEEGQLVIGLYDSLKYNYFVSYDDHKAIFIKTLAEHIGKQVDVLFEKMSDEKIEVTYIDPTSAFNIGGIDVDFE